MAERFYLTTPIYYPNAELHMGSAYTSVLADIVARYHRGLGEEVFFLTGSDEHAGKVARAARERGQEPQAFVDAMADSFKRSHDSLGVSYNRFIRTSDRQMHWPGAILLWRKLAEAGDLYKKSYSGLYCNGCEEFKTEKDLLAGNICALHETPAIELQEENYFFKLSRYTGKIRDAIVSDAMQIVPETRKNEILSLLEEGLQDVSFSRPAGAAPWGIPVPGDEAQVMYVWCDALANYLSAVGYGRDENERTKWWPADLHILGKDILRFHAAVWPGMLLSVGLPLPKKILAHGFVTSEGKKMSKSLGNVIDPKELVGEYGADAVRYYIAREIPPFEDGDLTREKFKEAYNANLANGLGNLVSRIMKMATSYFDAPIVSADTAQTHYRYPEYQSAMEDLRVSAAADIAWGAIGELDKEIQETEPFKVFKVDPEKAREMVRALVEGLYALLPMLEPILPETSPKIRKAILEHTMPEPLFLRK